MKAKQLVFSVILVLTAAAAMGDFPSFPICTAPGTQQSPHVSDRWVVWTDSRGGSHSNIYAWDMLTGSEFPVYTDAERTAEMPSVSGDVAVWRDYRNLNADIYGYNLVSQTPISVCTNMAGQAYPAISGDTVVWLDLRNGNWDIYGKRLSGGSDFPVYTMGDWLDHPAIDGDIVVWEGGQNGPSDILALNLATGQSFAVCTAESSQICPRISGNRVIWGDGRNGSVNDLYVCDITTGEEEFIASGVGSDYDISGDIVVWNHNWDLFGYNLATHTQFPICTALGPQGGG